MSEKVDWKMTADTQEVLRAWQQMASGMDKVIKKQEEMGRKAREAGDVSSQKLDGVIAKTAQAAANYMAMSRAIGMAKDLVTGLAAAQERANQKSIDAQMTRDVSFSNFRTIAGLIDDESAAQRAKTAINASANRAGVSLVQADQAATQLASSGVSVEDIIGGVLDEFLNTGKAMNALGKNVDPTATARAAAAMLSASGLQKDAAGFNRFGRTVSGLAETNIELADLENFSARAGVVKQMTGQSMEEMAAAFAVLRKQMPADVAATGYATFAQRLGPGKTRLQKRSISALGLEPEDIDFVGETFPVVIERLRKAMTSVDEATGKEAFKRIFGAEGAPAAAAFIADQDLARFTGLTQGQRFEKTADFAANTLTSRQQELQNRRDIEDERRNKAAQKFIMDRADVERLERGDRAAGIEFQRMIGDRLTPYLEVFFGELTEKIKGIPTQTVIDRVTGRKPKVKSLEND